MNPKNGLFLLALLLTTILVCHLVSAKFFVVDADPSNTDPGIIGFLVSDVNFFTHDDFLGGIPQFPYYIEFIGSDGLDVDYYR